MTEFSQVSTLPRKLGSYRLERLLGRGGMGVVYVAYDQRLERQVAIKRVLTGAEDPQRRERLRREARITAQLAHPAIVQVFDLIEAEGSDWIVMELIDGKTLARLLVEGPLGVDLTLQYGLQIVEGLAAAHQLGIVHRDLKTENVMILPDERVKILDFGLAKRFDFLTSRADDAVDQKALSESGIVRGTGRAMSPEQARGLEVGPRSDLFSFGVLIYETLTGVSPFRAETFFDTLERVVTHQPQPVTELADNVPPALAKLIERLLRKAPELRPANAREVADEIVHLAEERRFQARKPRDSAFDSEGTVAMTATGLLAADTPGVDSERASVDLSQVGQIQVGRFHLKGRPRWTIPFAVLCVTLATALAITVAVPRTTTAGRDLAVTHLATATEPDDLLRLYEEGMQAVRRADQPKSLAHAVDIFRRLMARDGDSAAAYSGLARAYWEKARNASGGADPVFLEQASAMAREAVRLDAYLADARVSLGLVQFSQGRYDEAREELSVALDLDPSNADAYYGLAKVANSLSRPDEAERYYTEAIRRTPASIYHNALGSHLYFSGRYDEAEKAFLSSLVLAPDNFNALRNLSSLYYAQGRMDEATDKLQAALKIRPHASLYSNLGTIFFSRGLYTKSAVAFEAALAMEGASNDHLYWINLADAYRQIPAKEKDAQRTYRRAIQMLDEEIEEKPDRVLLRSRRALARVRAGDRAGALEDVARLRDLGTGGDLYSLFRLAVAEELCGEREGALASLEKALRSGLSLTEVRHEPDLLALRADLRFHHLLVELDGL